jgi:hypothetical protein
MVSKHLRSVFRKRNGKNVLGAINFNMFVEILNNFNLEEYSHKDSRHQFFRML